MPPRFHASGASRLTRARGVPSAQVVCAQFDCHLRVSDDLGWRVLSRDPSASPVVAFHAAHAVPRPQRIQERKVAGDEAEEEEEQRLKRRWLRSRVASLVSQMTEATECVGEGCDVILLREGTTWQRRAAHALLGNARCRNGHAFCWECREAAHAPCTCDMWTKWTAVVKEHLSKAETMLGEEGAGRGAAVDGALLLCLGGLL